MNDVSDVSSLSCFAKRGVEQRFSNLIGELFWCSVDNFSCSFVAVLRVDPELNELAGIGTGEALMEDDVGARIHLGASRAKNVASGEERSAIRRLKFVCVGLPLACVRMNIPVVALTCPLDHFRHECWKMLT